MTQRPVVIVGAGPAGMAAALELIEAGIRPLIVDENPRPGGQIYRQPPETLTSTATSLPPLVQRFVENQSRLELALDTTVWGIFPPRCVSIIHSRGNQTIEAQHLLLAPGAYEYLPPFPGWTLPGVMTPGAAQAFVKGMHVVPGKRVLIAGTGPFLLVVAEYLHRAGMEVVGVVEMARARETLRALPGLMTQPGLLWQGARYHLGLRRTGIPLYRGHVLLEARGGEEVTEAVFAPCNADGYPDRSRSRAVAVDTVCAGYGFVPRIQLAQLAGCRLRFDEAIGGWVPVLDENLQTSVAAVWVAGDGGGVAGAVVAELEGRLAGLAIGRELGALASAEFERKRRPVVRRLNRLRRFRGALDRLYRPRPGLTALAEPDTLVCRCEELTRADVEKGVAAGGTDVRTLKVMTRLGMGPCQGQMCWPAMARFIAQRTGQRLEDLGPLSVRPPLVPIPLADLCEEEHPVGRNGTVAQAAAGVPSGNGGQP